MLLCCLIVVAFVLVEVLGNTLIKKVDLFLVCTGLHRLTDNILVDQCQIVHTFGRVLTLHRCLSGALHLVTIALIFVAFHTTLQLHLPLLLIRNINLSFITSANLVFASSAFYR